MQFGKCLFHCVEQSIEPEIQVLIIRYDGSINAIHSKILYFLNGKGDKPVVLVGACHPKAILFSPTHVGPTPPRLLPNKKLDLNSTDVLMALRSLMKHFTFRDKTGLEV